MADSNGNDYMLWATIGSAIFGALGFLFGVYTFFSSRKEARLIYEVMQVSDFDVPRELLREIGSAIISIKVRNTGSKMAENIKISAETASPIKTREVKSHVKDTTLTAERSNLDCWVKQMNPGEEFSLYLTCDGSPFESQLVDMKVTHSTGVGVDQRRIEEIKAAVGPMFLQMLWGAIRVR